LSNIIPNLPSSLAACTSNVSAEDDLHIWVPDTVIVGLVSPSLEFDPNTFYAGASYDLRTNLTARLAVAVSQILPDNFGNAILGRHMYVWGGGAGAFVMHLTTPGQDCLQRAIDAINYRVLKSGKMAFTLLPEGPDSDLVPVEITGASPDWYTIAAAGGNGVGGSPGGPPATATATANAPSGDGTGQTVVVLDTGDPLQPHQEVAPDPNTFPKLCPDTTGACYKEMSQLSKKMQEVDVPVRYENAHLLSYGSSPTTDITLREHGMFIADLIYHLAANATILL